MLLGQLSAHVLRTVVVPEMQRLEAFGNPVLGFSSYGRGQDDCILAAKRAICPFETVISRWIVVAGMLFLVCSEF
jgi:hypothetical protein